jgi:phytoene dehydrogenase-like protein
MSGTIAIIGGGMAGLSAGIYGRLNGYATKIFELHDIPGGLCTAWTRKGYTFDISLHILSCSRTGGMNAMWHDLGILPGRRLVDHASLGRVEDRGRSIDLSTDFDQLERNLLAVSPGDKDRIRELIGLGRRFLGADIYADVPSDLAGILGSLRMLLRLLPYLGILMRYRKVTVQEFAARFSDPLLRDAVRMIADAPGWPMPDMPLIILGFLLAGYHERNNGYPIGGSVDAARAVARRYAELGGELQTRARVERILVERNRAVGVRLADGTEHRADVVISAADGRSTLYGLLEGRYLPESVKRHYEGRGWRMYPPIVQVMLGVARDFSAEPHTVLFRPEKPVTVAGRTFPWLHVMHYGFDPGMAPPGKSVVQVWYTTDYEFWKTLHADRERYVAEKQRLAEASIAALDQRWPGFASQVEVVDVPTPVTYERYTGNWQGSPDGWCITTESMSQTIPRRLAGLDGFLMAGQWTVPFSGVPGAAMTGMHAIRDQCRADGRKFVRTPQGA